jgi:hypothetical protein
MRCSRSLLRGENLADLGAVIDIRIGLRPFVRALAAREFSGLSATA